jgi:hypothetical protein
MGIEDRLREDLRRSARTATVLTSCPRTCGRRSSTASPTGNEASSFRSRPWRSRWPPPWSLLWLVIAFTGARDQHLANPTVLSVGAGPSRHRGVLTLRSRCFGVSRLPSDAGLRPEQW